MKKHLLIAGMVSMATFGATAQTFDLEGWETLTQNNIQYQNTTTPYLSTLNEIHTYPSNPPETGFRTGNAHGGQYCAQIKSARVPVPVNVFVPGVLGTVNPFFSQSGFGTTLSYGFTGLPTKLSAWIKYEPVDGDSGEIFAHLTRYNGGARETLAVTSKKFYQAIPNWTQQELTFNYSVNNVLPDSIALIFVSSGGYNFSNLTQCRGKENSAMYIDDVELSGYAGISEVLFNGEELSVFPNPAENVLNLSYTQTIGNGTVSVLDMTGREVFVQAVSGNQFSVDLNTLKAGNYVAVLKEKSSILGRKAFVKK